MTHEKDGIAEADDGVELWGMVPRLLDANHYCVLATANAAGEPWATPVFFAARHDRELFWVSSPTSRHSRNIEARPTIGITIFDSTAPIGGAEALYLEAQASAVESSLHAEALGVLNARLPPQKALALADLLPTGPLQPYRATATRHYVLIRGGDTRFDNVVDERRPVRPPEQSRHT